MISEHFLAENYLQYLRLICVYQCHNFHLTPVEKFGKPRLAFPVHLSLTDSNLEVEHARSALESVLCLGSQAVGQAVLERVRIHNRFGESDQNHLREAFEHLRTVLCTGG